MLYFFATLDLLTFHISIYKIKIIIKNFRFINILYFNTQRKIIKIFYTSFSVMINITTNFIEINFFYEFLSVSQPTKKKTELVFKPYH